MEKSVTAREAAIELLRDVDEGSLPTIIVNNRHMRDISADALNALEAANGNEPSLFIRGGVLVRLQIDHTGASSKVLSQADLKGTLDRVANFMKENDQGEVPARPPEDVVRDILSAQYADLPELRSVSVCPVAMPDGRILLNSGYDSATGIYVHLNDLSNLRTDMPIQEAVSLLVDELLVDFLFATPADRASAMGAIIQPFVRPIINGCTPINLIEAPTRGTGKGLLLDVISLIPTGQVAPVATLPRQEDEVRKRITSELMEGHQMIVFDNVFELKSSTLEAALTTNVWNDRVLGHSRMIAVRNDAQWMATGNNVMLSDEMVRRVNPIRLDAGVERPENRTGFKHEELAQWVRENRAELVSACLSIIRAWMEAGMPMGSKTLGKFEAWARIIGGILAFANIGGFMENRERLYVESDMESQEWTSFCQEWYEVHREAPVIAGQLFRICKDRRLLLDVWAGHNDLGAMQRLGTALAGRRDRIFGGYVIRYAGQDRVNKTSSYRIERVQKRPPQIPAYPCEDGNDVAEEEYQNPRTEREDPRRLELNPRAVQPELDSGAGFAGVCGGINATPSESEDDDTGEV